MKTYNFKESKLNAGHTVLGKFFCYGGRKIYYVDPQRKDISFERWRISLYYKPGFAETVFFDTEEEYKNFLNKVEKYSYSNYEEFKQKKLVANFNNRI